MLEWWEYLIVMLTASFLFGGTGFLMVKSYINEQKKDEDEEEEIINEKDN